MSVRLAALFALLALSTAAAGPWDTHAPLPAPITNNAVTTHTRAGTTFVYTFMGLDSTKVFSGITTDAARLNTATNEWEILPPVPAVDGKIAASAVTLGDSVYVIGGYRVEANGSEVTARRMMVWDTVTDQWVDDAAIVPVKVDDMVAATWNDTHIVLVSGWSIQRNVRDVQFWEKATNTWSAATPVPDFGTFGGVGGIAGNSIVFMDGCADTATFAFDQVNRVLVGDIDPLDPLNVTWTDRGPHAGLPVYRGASWNVDGDPDRIVVAGGTDNPYNYNGIGYDGNPSAPLGQVFSYHIPTGTMVFHADLPVPTMDHRGFPYGDGRLWIVGGMEAGQQVTTRVASWAPDPVTSAPTIAAGDLLPRLLAYPNPARAGVTLATSRGERMEGARIVDVSGRTVRALGAGESFAWDLRDDAGHSVAAGVYFLSARIGEAPVARSVTVVIR